MHFGELKTYIYPTNFEVRDYQYNIVRSAFYHNLLVALPTGLGKTFIASTVMLNFMRWFPESKIVFMAPTKPLVAQQIKACCSITGIPTSKVAILLDKARKNREEIWNSRQVFFTTPQVVENDLCAGVVDPKSISLLVIDEAHRARGNYAYNNVTRFLNRFNFSFRILALTATPAADVEGVQEVIDNLSISKVEVRTEQSIDIIKYMKSKKICRRVLDISDEIKECIDALSEAIAPVLRLANEKGLIDVTDPSKINAFKCMEASRRLLADKSMPEGLKWANYFIIQLLGTVGQCLRRLNIYGVASFFSYFTEKYKEFKTKWNAKKSKNKLNADFYFSEPIKRLMEKREKREEREKGGKGDNDSPETVYSHPKIEAVMEELDDFFSEKKDSSSRVIIFTEYRESALEIVSTIEKADSGIKPHIFIGQAKEKDKFDEENYGKKKGANNKRKSKRLDDELRSNSRSSSENAQVTGMNQKLQKQIIKQFKNGEYNVLVATSIGEEGLDIGEVDLIICYDSTASPIKNIQRMGRTGRKRDGKVVLLFSSNEEMKFDKAMAGYEYIQTHIMKGDLISVCQQNRILPAEYKPQVVEKFIEIPEENMEIKREQDDDEVIRIATQYMLGKTPIAKTRAKRGKQFANDRNNSKRQKRFFLPDNAITGFRNVSNMLQAECAETREETVEEQPKQQQQPRARTVLDDLMESSSDDDALSPMHVHDAKSFAVVKDEVVDSLSEDEQANKSEDQTPATSFIDGIDNTPKQDPAFAPHAPDQATIDLLGEELLFSEDEDMPLLEPKGPKPNEKESKLDSGIVSKTSSNKALGIPRPHCLIREASPKPRFLMDEEEVRKFREEQRHLKTAAAETTTTTRKSLGATKSRPVRIAPSSKKQETDAGASGQLSPDAPVAAEVQEVWTDPEAEADDPFDDDDLDEVIAHYASKNAS
ncbi:uncharacterized protein LODBEIA_P50570 [Lodderomyces beijingensis]|uniref:ATP-dependent DNA helicase n=1 Tax=Lodderomyces beijingensis TaxID=1775926 RepID=A0ABP0ZT19_9ASCO